MGHSFIHRGSAKTVDDCYKARFDGFFGQPESYACHKGSNAIAPLTGTFRCSPGLHGVFWTPQRVSTRLP